MLITLNRKSRMVPVAGFVAAMSLSLTACYMEVTDSGEDEYGEEDDTRVYKPQRPSALADAKECESGLTHQETGQCYEEDDYRWRTSCKSADCQAVKVFVHYMLPDDLGDGRAVHVEAFDNPNFVGSPTSSVRVASFSARTGEWRSADVFLEPGEYYMRAFLTTADDTVVPYTMSGMTLVAGQPVGVHGALSGAEMVSVAPRHQAVNADPVHIRLTKLFKQPGSEPETKAYLRAQFTVSSRCEIPDGRKVWLNFYESDDLAAAPVAAFPMASEALLVQGRVGRADFVTPSLPEGQYIVFAYVDENGNELFDLDEPSALHKRNDVAAKVTIRANRTESIALKLLSAAEQAGEPEEQADANDATAGE